MDTGNSVKEMRKMYYEDAKGNAAFERCTDVIVTLVLSSFIEARKAMFARDSRILRNCSCSSKIIIFQKFGVKIGVR